MSDTENISFFDAHPSRYTWLFPLLARLPVSLGQALARRYGDAQSRRCHGERNGMQHYISQSFPQLTAAQIHNMSLDYFRLASLDILDTYHLRRLGAKRLARAHIRTRGMEPLLAARAAGQPVLLALGHFGRFWMAGVPLVAQGLSVGTMTRDRTDDNRHGLGEPEFRYRQLKLHTLQQAFGGPFLYEGDSPRQYYEAQSQHVMGIAFDVPLGREMKHTLVLDFLGQPARFSTSVARIARRVDGLIFPYFMEETPQLTAVFHSPIQVRDHSDEAVTSLLVKGLEQAIQQRPGHWWLWNALPAFRV